MNRKVISTYGKIELSEREFDLVAKFGETGRGTIDYMQVGEKGRQTYMNTDKETKRQRNRETDR